MVRTLKRASPRANYRPFSSSELAAVVARYPDEGAIALAEEFGRKRGDIVSVAGRLGVHCNLVRRWTAELDSKLAELVLTKRTYVQIAALIDRTPTAVGKRVQTLGLCAYRLDREKRRVEARLLQRPDRGGARSRWAKERIALGEHGWPPDLNPKEVLILETLRVRGPMSRRNLSLAIGESPRLSKKHTLRTHSGMSVMTRVQARSLVARLTLQQRRKRVIIFTLTANALVSHGTHETVTEFNALAAGLTNKE